MEIDVLGLALRSMHIIAAITAVGGIIFMRIALLPAISTLPVEQQVDLQSQLRRRWSKAVMVSILFLLVSGFYNFITLIIASKQWVTPLPKLYHPVFGIKFILALGVFFIASALAGRGRATQKFRDNPKKWLTINLVLAVLIICLSGLLRSTHVGPNVSQPTTIASETEAV